MRMSLFFSLHSPGLMFTRTLNIPQLAITYYRLYLLYVLYSLATVKHIGDTVVFGEKSVWIH